MKYLPLLVVAVLVVLLVSYTVRSRRQQAATFAEQVERITAGAAVMTTSGLHGRVASLNGDGTVQLSIADGVEVRWEVAALRDATALPERYARGVGADPGPDQSV